MTASHSPRDQYDFEEGNVSKTILMLGDAFFQILASMK